MDVSKPQSKMRVRAVYIYPIKGLRGCSPPSLKATPVGFSYDRRFMVQQLSSGKHLSVAKFPEIALFVSELDPPPSSTSTPTTIRVRYTKTHTFDKPDQNVDDEILEVPLEPDVKGQGLKEVEYSMHGSPTVGYEMPGKYSDWFSQRLGYAVRLVYVGSNRRKVLGTVSPNVKADWSTTKSKDDNDTKPASNQQGWLSYAASTVGNMVGLPQTTTTTDSTDELRHKGVDEGIGYADVAPFLVISTKSWEDAASRLPADEELDITKFRPNIIVEGATEAWEEDYWAGLSLGGGGSDGSDGQPVQIVFTSNCARCASLNVDYDTGKTGKGEAGKVLKLLSKDRRVDLGTKWSPVFGRYGFLAGDFGPGGHREVEISAGDQVDVIQWNSERTRFQWPGISTDK